MVQEGSKHYSLCLFPALLVWPFYSTHTTLPFATHRLAQLKMNSIWGNSHLITITAVQFSQPSTWPTRRSCSCKIMHNDISQMHLSAAPWGLNAWPPQCASMCALKTQATAVSRLCARKCSRPIYDLILIIHADILHSATVSNPRLQKLIVGH